MHKDVPDSPLLLKLTLLWISILFPLKQYHNISVPSLLHLDCTNIHIFLWELQTVQIFSMCNASTFCSLQAHLTRFLDHITKMPIMIRSLFDYKTRSLNGNLTVICTYVYVYLNILNTHKTFSQSWTYGTGIFLLVNLIVMFLLSHERTK